MSPPVAVVGAGGFVGRHLTRALAAAGHEVAAFTRAEPCVVDGRAAQGLAAAPVVFYLATSVNLGIAEQHPEYVTADHDALVQCLDALAAVGSRPTFVFASSASGYATDETPPFTEQSRTCSDTAYGQLKLRCEQLLLDRADAVVPVVARLASMYGPGHHTEPGHGVIAHWLTALAQDRPLVVLGDTEVRRDFVYVDDVVEAFLRMHALATGPQAALPPVLNISSGLPVTLAQLLDAVVTVTGVTPVIERLPARKYDRRELWQDSGLARRTLGWRAATSLPAGLRHTWEAVLEQHGPEGDVAGTQVPTAGHAR